MGAAEWREADDLCSRAALLDSLNVAPTPSTVACLAITCTKDDAKTCQHVYGGNSQHECWDSLLLCIERLEIPKYGRFKTCICLILKYCSHSREGAVNAFVDKTE